MAGAKLKVLIVENEQKIRTSLSQNLSKNGCRVRSAPDGFSALGSIRDEVPDVLLANLNLPGMSGFELLIVVRRRFPAIQVIAMGGASPGNMVPAGVAADAFLQESNGVDSLLRLVESMPRRNGITPKPSAAPTPIWVSKNENVAEEEACGTIECPECLRTFPHAINGVIDPIGIIDCIVCGSLIRYAIV